MDEPILDHLRHALLVGDGAMGTMLYARGISLGVSYDELNLSRPNIVCSIHEEYVAAGAGLIESNTFGANRVALTRHHLEDHVAEINRLGVALARQAAGNSAYVAGAIGPIYGDKLEEITEENLISAYKEQITALHDARPDAIIFETFLTLNSLSVALRNCRSLTDLPLICQLALDEYGRTRDGVDVTEAFHQLYDLGANVVGANCRSGPRGLIGALEQVPLSGLILSAFPNAGSPDYVDGRFMYQASPGYFAESAIRLRDQGVRLIGGCCGTTPDHILAVAQALEGRDVVTKKRPRVVVREPQTEAQPLTEKPAEPTVIDLVKRRVTVIVELDPPRDLRYKKTIDGSAALKEAGADAVTMADNSLAETRISNMAIGHIVKQKVGIRPFLHVTCRDRNMVGMQSHLLGLHALGIDHVLAVTGDPVKFGDQPGASNVYDTSSFELIQLIKQLNRGVGFSGKELNGNTNFTVAAAFEPKYDKLDRHIRRLEKKIESGADMVMTQPIFDPRRAKEVYNATKHLGFPIFLGIMPLASSGNAELLHNEVPGFTIPNEVRARMAKVGRGPKARREGVEIAKTVADGILEYFNGIYMMTPFNRYSMTVALTKHVTGK